MSWYSEDDDSDDNDIEEEEEPFDPNSYTEVNVCHFTRVILGQFGSNRSSTQESLKFFNWFHLRFGSSFVYF